MLPGTALKPRVRILIQALMVVMTIAALYPVYFIIVTSLKSGQEYLTNLWGPPIHPTLDHFYEALFKRSIPLWFRNSVIVTLGSVVLSTAVATLGAYAIARGRFVGRTVLRNLMVALLVVPPVVLVIPMFILMVQVGTVNTLSGVIFFYTGLLLPFSIFLLTNFFRTMPQDVLDAGIIDGCSQTSLLYRIVVPISAPALVTLVVVNAVWVWNELLIALVFLQNEELRTLMAGLTLFQGRYSTNQPLILAGSAIAVLPPLLLYLFGQRFFIRGLTAGSFR